MMMLLMDFINPMPNNNDSAPQRVNRQCVASIAGKKWHESLHTYAAITFEKIYTIAKVFLVVKYTKNHKLGVNSMGEI